MKLLLTWRDRPGGPRTSATNPARHFVSAYKAILCSAIPGGSAAVTDPCGREDDDGRDEYR
jgi:hypothetical protein